MFSQNFQAWKLHTWQDYAYFFAVLFTSIAVFYFISRAIIKRRNDASAQKRVKKKLKVKGGKVYHGATFDFGGRQLHFDHLLIDAAGIVAMRTIGWGIRIYGSAEEATWKAEDNKKEVKLENPIRALEQGFETMRKGFAQGDIYGVSIEPLAIFADPFAAPELYLGRDSDCITFQQLGAWVKNRRMRAESKADKPDKLDTDKVIAYLDKILVTPQVEQ